MIIFSKVTKKFSDGTVVLKDISFTVDEGEFVFLVGPSGAGKTIISRMLIREMEPTAGKIFVDREEISKFKKNRIPDLRRKIGIAFQDFKLFFDKTINENIALPLLIRKKRGKKSKEKIKEVLEQVGLEGKGEFFPVQLSGGELQRVGIARALICEPKILFADEPTGNLDQETGAGIIALLKEINNQGTTVICATHDMGLLDSFKGRVIKLEGGGVEEDPVKRGKEEKKKSDKKKEKVKKPTKSKKSKKENLTTEGKSDEQS
jgi:cell division transport system ATP-binding protein